MFKIIIFDFASCKNKKMIIRIDMQGILPRFVAIKMNIVRVI